MLALTIILVTSICGLVAAPVSAIAFATIALSGHSYSRQVGLFPHAYELRIDREITGIIRGGIPRAFIVCSTAFAVGSVLRSISVG